MQYNLLLKQHTIHSNLSMQFKLFILHFIAFELITIIVLVKPNSTKVGFLLTYLYKGYELNL